MDELRAVVEVIKPIWTRICEIEFGRKESRESWWRKVEIGLLIGGAVVSWWLSPSGKFEMNLGGWMMVIGGWTLASHLIEEYGRSRELDHLGSRQSDFLYRWEATGASSDDFWRFRNHFLESMKFDDDSPVSTDERRLLDKMSELWLDVRRHLVWSLTG